jgi:hypothetical protein
MLPCLTFTSLAMSLMSFCLVAVSGPTELNLISIEMVVSSYEPGFWEFFTLLGNVIELQKAVISMS